MNIIAQDGATVNIYSGKVTITTQRRLRKAREARALRLADAKKPIYIRWDEHKADAQRLGDRLIAAGLPKRGWRLKMCSNELIISQCTDCGHITIKGAQLCRDRLCPLCAWRLAIKRYAAMQSIMAYLYAEYNGLCYALVTLTVKNCRPEALSDTIKSMSTAWHDCTKQRWARRDLVGWARSLECTYNPATDEIHPHYHLIVMHIPGDGTPQKLVAEWLDRASRAGLTATAAAQHIDAITDTHTPGDSLVGAICETYKYMVKSSDTLAMPLHTLRTFATEIAGYRLVSFGGVIKTAAAALLVDDMDNPDDCKDTQVCTHCGSTSLDDMIARWSLRGMHYYTMQGQSMIDALHSAVDSEISQDIDDKSL